MLEIARAFVEPVFKFLKALIAASDGSAVFSGGAIMSFAERSLSFLSADGFSLRGLSESAGSIVS